MDRPSTNRPPDRASIEAACFARMAARRSGPIATIVTSTIVDVAAAAAARAAKGSMLSYAVRSRTPKLVKGPDSAFLAQSTMSRPSRPGYVLGSPTPTLTSHLLLICLALPDEPDPSDHPHHQGECSTLIRSLRSRGCCPPGPPRPVLLPPRPTTTTRRPSGSSRSRRRRFWSDWGSLRTCTDDSPASTSKPTS